MRVRALVVLALLLVTPAAARRWGSSDPVSPLSRCQQGVRSTAAGLVCAPAAGAPVPGLAAWWMGTPLDLSVATASDLTVVPGIGPALARRIVEDRAARGPFTDARDLERVKGIGPKLALRIAAVARFR